MLSRSGVNFNIQRRVTLLPKTFKVVIIRQAANTIAKKSFVYAIKMATLPASFDEILPTTVNL